MPPIATQDPCASCRSRYCERLPDPGRMGCIGVIPSSEPQGRIFVNRQMVVDANALPSARWLLLLVLLHEAGHHLDALLRNHYSDKGGDTRGDEGETDLPATNYIHFAQVYVRHLMNFLAIGNLAYESHFARKQHWHSMCPWTEDGPVLNEEKMQLTNGDVKKEILDQLGEWYQRALERRNTGKPGIGLMNLGKMLHTVQDSYALSHAWRRFVGDHDETFWPKKLLETLKKNWLKGLPCEDSHHGTIWNFQSYHAQDGDLHAVADGGFSVGYDEALEASTHILKSYKAGESWEQMRTYLDKTVYVIHPERQDVRAGDSHPWFRKRLTEAEEPDEEIRNKDEKTDRSEKKIKEHVISLRKMVDSYKKNKGKTVSVNAEHWFAPYGELLCSV